MNSSFNPKRFGRALLRWYGAQRRDLPWRGERDPYRIWVSEVMLQQTRVAVVQERYPAFLRLFPTVSRLARARVADVLAAWSGLGYYRRARALHAAAKVIVAQHAGELPRSAEELQELPGIGRYTAAAVASIAFGEPAAVVDGNVERVLGRVLGDSKADPWAVAAELLDPQRASDFNQAMMELGATVCMPREPLCERCPVHSFCRTRGHLASPQKVRRRKRRVSYALLQKAGRVYLVQRSSKSRLMPQMWELPQLRRTPRAQPWLKVRHAITTTDFEVRVFVADSATTLQSGRWVALNNVSRLPLTGLTRKVLAQLHRQAQPQRPR